MAYRGTPHIKNEAAYEAAIERHIKANRAKTGRARWFAAFDDAQTIKEWLFGFGEFDVIRTIDPRCTLDEDNGWVDHYETLGDRYYGASCKCKTVAHPLTRFTGGSFCNALRDAIDEWGGLTERQHLAARASLQRAKDTLTGREVKRAAEHEQNLKSQHVGAVGERRRFELTVDRVLEFEGIYMMTYFNICRDESGNVVVYKGTNRWTRGEVIRCVATIKKHDSRDGVAQTIIQRPKVEC